MTNNNLSISVDSTDSSLAKNLEEDGPSGQEYKTQEDAEEAKEPSPSELSGSLDETQGKVIVGEDLGIGLESPRDKPLDIKPSAASPPTTGDSTSGIESREEEQPIETADLNEPETQPGAKPDDNTPPDEVPVADFRLQSSIKHEVEIKIDREDSKSADDPTEGGRAQNLPELEPIPRSGLQKYLDIFLPSPDFDLNALQFGSPNGRVFVVYGPRLSGKFTSAINIALKVRPNILTSAIQGGEEESERPPEVFRYRRHELDTGSLESVLRGIKRPGSVLIIRNAFERNIHTRDLTGAELDHLHHVLEAQKLDLILTTDLDSKALHDVDAPKISAVVPDLQAVYEKHLVDLKHKDHLSDEITVELSKAWCWVAGELSSPSHIGRFIAILRSSLGSSWQSSEEALRSIAKSVGEFGQVSAQAWFGNLPPNERLFTLLIGLFEGIDLDSLTEIYTLTTRFFRSDGVEDLKDPRATGLHNLLLSARAQDEDDEVRFLDLVTRREVERQIENHSHLLWSLNEIFLDLIRAHENRRFGHIRMFLGTGIGRLGLRRRSKFSAFLDTVAGSQSGGVATTAGYALDQACRQDPDVRRWCLNVLESWILSGNPDRMWAAGSAVWRVYRGHLVGQGQLDDSFLRGLRHRLRMFVQRANVFNSEVRGTLWKNAQRSKNPRELNALGLNRWATNNVNACFFAINRMMESDPSGTCAMLGDWMSAPPTDSIHQLSQAASFLWLGISAEAESRPSPTLRSALASLSPNILLTDDDSLLERLFQTLESWFRDDLEVEMTAVTLLNLINGSTPDQLRRIRLALLGTWMESASAEARLLARQLLRRVQFLVGLPPHPNPLSRLILVYESTRIGAERDFVPRLALWTEVLLNGSMQIASHPLGRVIGLGLERDTESQTPSISDLRCRPYRAQLIGPLTESLPSDEMETLLVITRNHILDWKDFDFPEVEMLDSLTLIKTGKATNQPKAQSWTLALAKHDSSSFCSGIDDLRIFLVANSERPRRVSTVGKAALSNRVAALENLESIRKEMDPLALIVEELLAGLEHDLEATIETLCASLDCDDDSLLCRVALAVGISYFKTIKFSPLPSLRRIEVLDKLARSMCHRGWGGAEPVLSAVRLWLEDSILREALLPEHGATARLVDWIEPLLSTCSEELGRLTAEWLKGEFELNKVKPEVASAIGRLWRRLALISEPDKALTQIEGPYALILVDFGLSEADLQQKSASLVRALSRELEDQDMPYLLYELGRSLPIAVPGVEDPKTLGARVSHSTPRLLGPTLELHRMDDVRGVLLVTTSNPWDLSDWRSTVWIRKLKFAHLAPLTTEPFEVISHADGDISPLLAHLTETS